MLELRDAKLQLVEVVPGNEVQVLDDAAQERHRLLSRTGSRAADARRQLAEKLLDRLDDSGITGHDRAAVSAAVGDASRAEPALPAPTASP
jgi:hypothetical protein